MDKKSFVLAANVVRGLAMDGVQKANSGHPGMPMGAADYAATLFLKHLKFSPTEPAWPDRDRFVLSAGHGVMLQYALLHLAGYDLKLEELQQFRQYGSRTPGHPEYGHTPGVEATTGPLGQGCANVVGMALAERMLAAQFNTPDITIVDHHTIAIASDGDMMEGISHEAFAIAGHLKLDKLIVIYDYNNITIEGKTSLAYSDDVKKRFEAYHWNVIEIDGHDLTAIDQALTSAKAFKGKPTIIIAKTRIAKGSPNLEDNPESHGAPLGADEIKATKKGLGLPETEFHVPAEVYKLFESAKKQGEEKAADWKKRFAAYRKKYPDKSIQWDAALNNTVPAELEKSMPKFSEPVATRAAGGKIMQEIAKLVPSLVGGSADLTPSTRTGLNGMGSVTPGTYSGRNLHFGIREHGMAGILNGMALHGGFRVFGSTFLVFLDYCRSSVRLSAMMGLPVVYVFTHDSIYVGEDGPTHQPISHFASLRCIPNITVLRPADATETAASWVIAMRNLKGPTVLLLTRQNLPVLDRTQYPAASMVEKGAYTLWQSAAGKPDVILIASGSEVFTALDAAKVLAKDMKVRLVSMVSWELFEKQAPKYREEVLPSDCISRVVVEAASPMGWEKYAGPCGEIIGMRQFGVSAPYKVLAQKFGFTPENVVETARKVVKKNSSCSCCG